MPGRPGGRFGKSFFNRLDQGQKQNYIDYLNGARQHTVPRALDANKRARVSLAVVPFGTVPSAATPADEDYVKTTATIQAIGIAKLIETSLVTFGIEDSPAAGNSSFAGFYPALAKPTLRAESDAGSNGTSSFTGKTYKKYNTRSGSIPFGRAKTASTTSDYRSQMNALITLFNTANLTGAKKMSISFSPEYWDKAQESVSAAASGVAGSIDF